MMKPTVTTILRPRPEPPQQQPIGRQTCPHCGRQAGMLFRTSNAGLLVCVVCASAIIRGSAQRPVREGA